MTMFGKTKTITPPVINGHTRDQQPEMWRTFYKSAFKAENTPFTGNLFENNYLNQSTLSPGPLFNLSEVNSAIDCINTNESYEMHYHWKSLHTYGHAAKICLTAIFNSWGTAF